MMGREPSYNGNPKTRPPLWSAEAYNTRSVPRRVLPGPLLRDPNRFAITTAIMFGRDAPACASAILFRRREAAWPSIGSILQHGIGSQRSDIRHHCVPGAKQKI
jgi:hypothetical protein